MIEKQLAYSYLYCLNTLYILKWNLLQLEFKNSKNVAMKLFSQKQKFSPNSNNTSSHIGLEGIRIYDKIPKSYDFVTFWNFFK